MKIAVIMYPIGQLGGIVSNNENLMYGLKENGHGVDFFIFGWQNSFRPPKYSNFELIKNHSGWYRGFCCAAHQSKGWNLPLDRKIPYKGVKNLKAAISILKRYDLVIWQIPVPTMQKKNQGNTDWIDLYRANKRNLIYSHDAHMQNRYPYIYEVKDYLVGAVGVNLASYHSLAIDLPKIMVFSSHNLKDMKMVFDFDKRDKGFLAPQTFKEWKHVGDIIRAIPYMGRYAKYVAGAGREHSNMVSDTAKAQYLNKKGVRIWDVALTAGLDYLGWITPRERNQILKKITCLIDPSWNLNFAKHGDHFNRTVIDAIKNGALPIARNYGISTNSEGVGEIFVPDENYVMIRHDASPQEFAENVDYSVKHPKWKKILKNNYSIIKAWDRRLCAKHFVDFSKGKPSGYFNKIECPSSTPKNVIFNSRKIMKDFFGFNVNSLKETSAGIKDFF